MPTISEVVNPLPPPSLLSLGDVGTWFPLEELEEVLLESEDEDDTEDDTEVSASVEG